MFNDKSLTSAASALHAHLQMLMRWKIKKDISMWDLLIPATQVTSFTCLDLRFSWPETTMLLI